VASADDTAPSFVAALNAFVAFQSNTNANHIFCQKIVWPGEEPHYVVTIPATMSWSESSGTATGSVTISAYDSGEGKASIPADSEVRVRVADNNVRTLKPAGAPALDQINYSLAKDATALNDGDTVATLDAATAGTNATGITQAFTATVVGTPAFAGDYTGTITFAVEFQDANEEP
jgi:hypothetical protein